MGEIARRMPGCCDDLAQAGDREDREPHPHDRPEEPARRRPVPKRWIGEQHREDDERDRDDERSSDGAATSRPSTAESTEIAGVIIPSP